MTLEWFKCKGNQWCNLFKLDLNHEYLQGSEGVFVIWTGAGNNTKFLSVGYGNIGAHLKSNKAELAIQAFQHIGVYVSWAEAPESKQPGISLFLTKALNPAIISSVPKAMAIKVNLPWEEVD
jgi:hypothetical protein